MSIKPAWFQILLTLAEGHAHGAEIRRKTRDRAGGEVELYPAMLYGSLDELTAKEWIIELDDQEARPPDANPRQRSYRITASGREALSQEANRLQALVESVTRALGIS